MRYKIVCPKCEKIRFTNKPYGDFYCEHYREMDVKSINEGELPDHIEGADRVKCKIVVNEGYLK